MNRPNLLTDESFLLPDDADNLSTDLEADDVGAGSSISFILKDDRSDGASNNHHSHVHPHVHNEESLRRLVNRLSRIEGHIRGIKTMVQHNEPCPNVLIQIAAVRGALDRVARIILDEHLTECIARAATEGNIDVELEQLKAALDRFLPREKKKEK